MIAAMSQERKDQMDDIHTFVPDHMRQTFIDYIEKGYEPGGFARAVLENNLVEAFGRADHINQMSLQSIVSWVYNYAPSACWGSPEKVDAWLGRFR